MRTEKHIASDYEKARQRLRVLLAEAYEAKARSKRESEMVFLDRCIDQLNDTLRLLYNLNATAERVVDMKNSAIDRLIDRILKEDDNVE
jgi:ribosome assembly protein YihI (activator of Der GTPase)